MSPLLVIPLLIVIGLPLLGFTIERILAARDRRRYPPPGKRIDVGGYCLHIQIMGQEHNGPTVVLESGVGCSGLDWGLTQSQIGQFAHVVAYDRAGTGWSDRGPEPRAPQPIVRELLTLLENAGIEPPYILVGHSFGGLYIRQFARERPDAVVGMVLVDSSHPDILSERDVEGEITRLRRVQLIKGIGLLRFMLSRFMHQYDHVPRTDRAKYQAINLRNTSMVLPEARPLFENGIDLPDSVGDIPLVIVSRSLLDESSASQRWHRFQEDLVKLSPQASRIVTDRGSHYIMLTEPDKVVEAVRQVVDAVKGRVVGEQSLRRSENPMCNCL